jgi:hypothetical protein
MRMNSVKSNGGLTVTHLVTCDPDQLIEIGHRMKAAAFDQALPGDSVLMPLTSEITLCYHPAREFVKPVHRSGPGLVTSIDRAVLLDECMTEGVPV